MLLQPDKIGPAIAAFFDGEIMPKAVGIQKLTLALAGVGLARQGAILAKRYAEVLRMIGVADADGNIDIDVARDLAVEAFAKSGKVQAMGFSFGPDDVEIAYEIAKKFAV